MRFAQLHFLTVYPPSNLNRDDVGRPKSAIVGGTERLRVSSQAVKRAVRTSECFQTSLDGHLGSRTRRVGDLVEAHLIGIGAEPGRAGEIARQVASIFGEVGDGSRTAQLAFVSPEERESAIALAESIYKGDVAEFDIRRERDRVLRRTDTAVDVSLFGRMLAASPQFNREAAAQISHAVTTHRAPVEDDFFTAVDDLQRPEEDAGAGAGYMGDQGFGSGVFYLYTCIDRSLLVRNLGDDTQLAEAGLKALVEALATVSPTGKQASYASRARASFILAEVGSQQPRSLISSYQKAVTGDDILAESVECLLETREDMDRAYGACSEKFVVMNVGGGGTLADIQDLVAGNPQ